MKSGRRQHGQGAVEFVVIFFCFATLLLGLFEMTRVFRAKQLLNTATFAAARAGSLSNARLGPMQDELANGMISLFMQADRSPAGITSATVRAKAMAALPGIGVAIVSPTAEIFDQLKVSQHIRRSDEADYHWQDVIPNDNLRWRPRELATLGDGGEINLQDANLLKVRSVWCHRLIVPALDHLILAIAELFVPDVQPVCSAISGGKTAGVARADYIAIASDAVLRMQSPVVADSLP